MRQTLDVGMLSIEVPEGWDHQHQVSLLLPAHEAFRPTIVITEESIPDDLPAILPRLVSARRDSLARTLPHFELRAAGEEVHQGHMVARLDYTWRNAMRVLRQRQMLWPSGRRLISVTFTDVAAHFAQTLPRFEAWLETFGWDDQASV